MRQPEILDANLQFRSEFDKRKKTDLIVLHHAAVSTCTIHDVHRWHLNNGWLGCGYHYFVAKTGEIHRGRPEDAVGAHVTGVNTRSVGICAEGDFMTERMQDEQKLAIIHLVKWIVHRYPGASIKGHRDLAPTQCPGKNYPFDEIVEIATGTPILGQKHATVKQAEAWARACNAAAVFIDLAALYWQEAPLRGEVRPEVAYAQSAKETAFGRFGGVIPGPEWHNWCGLKTTKGGANNDPNAHARFPDNLTGVRAHLGHLALYAGAPGYPRDDTPDPRHFPYIVGTAKTVEQLSQRWAGSGYGESIVNDCLTGLLDTPEPEPTDNEKEELRARVQELETQIAVLRDKIDKARKILE
jgi:hypothetical protein